MSAPGVAVTVSEAPPSRFAPTDTAVWFVCGVTEKGPVEPTMIKSMAEYGEVFGARVSYGILYDSLDTFFREGGRTACVSRVTGPSPVLAHSNLLDAVGGVSLVVNAKSFGVWANGLSVASVAGSSGGTFVIVITSGSTELERSGDLVDVAAAVSWAAHSDYIRLVLGASANDPATATVLASGTDDHTNATDATWQSALDKFGADLGPGQVSYPGRTSSAAYGQLIPHAESHFRVALLDLPDTGTAATLEASAGVARAIAGSRYAAAFAPWAIVPGVIPGTTRTVPYSAVEAGIIARNDATLSADDPAAGDNGQAFFVTDLSQPDWDETTRDALNKASVNVVRRMFGGIRTYGYRSLTDPIADPDWVDFGNARQIMDIAAHGHALLESFMFKKIDGRGRLFSKVDAALTSYLNGLWLADALYGDTPLTAFLVDVITPNTPTTIAANELHAIVAVRISPMAEMITLHLIKVPVSQSL